MVQISVIIIAGLIFLFSYSQGQPSNDIKVFLTISTTLAFTLLPAILAYFFGVIATRRLPEQHQIRVRRLYFVKKLFFAFEVLVLITFLIELYYLNLPLLIDRWLSFFKFTALRKLIAMIPLVAGILLIRLVANELSRRVYGTRRERKEFLSTQLKFMLFPMFPLLFYLSFLDIAELLPLQFQIFFIGHAYLSIFIIGILIVITYIAAPKFLQFLWKSKPIENQWFKDRIKAFAKQHDIKFKELSVWQTGKARIANAGVTGILPRFRKIFLTDVLLENFTTEEIESIIAHEFGHIKYKHLPIYLAFSLVYFICYTFFYTYAVPVWENIFGGGSISKAIIAILFFITYFVIIFRYLSRKFERQADLYAVSVSGAPETFKHALDKLSYMNYVPQKIKKWLELFHTHPSIDHRLEFVDRVIAGDKSVLKYSRTLIETKIILVLLPLLLSLFFININKIIPPAEVHYEKGCKYFQEEMFDKAADEFNLAVTEDADFADAHYILSLCYAEKEKFNPAKVHLLEVLRIDEDNKDAQELLTEVYYGTGIRYFQDEKNDDAIEEFSSAIAINPDFADAHYLLALSYVEQEKLRKAKVHLLKVLRIEDNKNAKKVLAKVHYGLARQYFREEMVDKAIEELNSAVIVDPDFDDAHYVLGLTYAKQEKLQKAEVHLSETLRTDKDNKDAKKLLEKIQVLLEKKAAIAN